MRPTPGHVATFVLSIGLFACGFHLRGEAHYAFATLFLNPTPALPLTTELKRSLEGIGSAAVTQESSRLGVTLTAIGKEAVAGNFVAAGVWAVTAP